MSRLSSGWRPWLVAVLFLGLAACGPRYSVEVPPAPPRAEVRWQTVMVLGDQAEGPREALLGHPTGVRTDADGTIYVGDRAAAAIKVYDPSGRFLHQIGRRGQEPGELVEISCFELLDDGTLLVADGVNLRLTHFGPEGELLATHPMDHLSMLWPREAWQLPSGEVVFAYKMPSHDRNGTARPDAAELLHVFSSDLGAKQDAFGSASRLVPPGALGDRLLQQSPGRLWVDTRWTDGKGSLLLAPGVYSGQIHRYRLDQGSWRWDGQLQGYIEDPNPFLEATPERSALEGLTFSIRSRRGRFAGFHRNESRGLFRRNDGTLVHFTLVAEGDGRTFGVELYDEEDRLVAFGPLERVEARPDAPTALATHVEWMDAAGRFYVRRHQDGRTTLEIAVLEEAEAGR